MMFFVRSLRASRTRLLSLSILLSCVPGCGPGPRGAAAPPSESEAIGPRSAVGELAPGEPLTQVPVEADDARLGSPNAAVTLVAFLDFQCGFCAEGYRTMRELRSRYSDDDLRIVFKHLPLRSHPLALPAAVAGQAVVELAGSEAFFQFADRAFANQALIDYNQLALWAEESGVPLELYNETASDELTLRRVAQDAGLARQVGVGSTPTFFINGRLIGGAQDIEFFEQVIKEELGQMGNTSQEDWGQVYQARVQSNMKSSLVESLLAQDPNDYRAPLDGSPAEGASSASVTLVMFTDFECPFCKKAESTLLSLRKKYESDLRFVFKQLPLPFHKHALPAARLSAAVHIHVGNDEFWKVSRTLFEISPELDEHHLKKLGARYGLTSSQVKLALSGKDVLVEERIEKDQILAEDILARGTPHFFINGKRLSGARPLEHFEALIDHEMLRAQELAKGGTAKDKVYDKLQANALSPGAPQKIQAQLTTVGHATRGPLQAPIVIHAFSDFQCPFCRNGEENLSELERLYPDQILLVWHDTPLPFHPLARPAARAGREAYRQKGNAGFWALHELMFGLDAQRAEIEPAQLLAHGKKIGLDTVLLEAALSTDKSDDAINEDIELATSLGIRGTPAYIIGDYLVTGAKPLRYLERIVELTLKDGAEK